MNVERDYNINNNIFTQGKSSLAHNRNNNSSLLKQGNTLLLYFYFMHIFRYLISWVPWMIECRHSLWRSWKIILNKITFSFSLWVNDTSIYWIIYFENHSLIQMEDSLSVTCFGFSERRFFLCRVYDCIVCSSHSCSLRANSFVLQYPTHGSHLSYIKYLFLQR